VPFSVPRSGMAIADAGAAAEYRVRGLVGRQADRGAQTGCSSRVLRPSLIVRTDPIDGTRHHPPNCVVLFPPFNAKNPPITSCPINNAGGMVCPNYRRQAQSKR